MPSYDDWELTTHYNYTRPQAAKEAMNMDSPNDSTTPTGDNGMIVFILLVFAAIVLGPLVAELLSAL
jgi:hypothetical protein